MSTTKQDAIEAIQTLPEGATYDDIIEALALRQAIAEGLADLDRGDHVPHDVVAEHARRRVEAMKR